MKVLGWGRVSQMTGGLMQDEVGRQRDQRTETETMPLLVEELKKAKSNRVQGTELQRRPRRH